MADFSTEHAAARPGREAWQLDNDRGLSLAADGDWAEATEAFAAAADGLARALPSTSGSHEPLALVLNNLAQAKFRVGRVEEAVQHAQRACALRVAIAGEDAMPVARARTDLAVMLAATGRLDEARSLVQRAISAIEHRVGEEDARLAVVLENAARIALAAGSPANAEPLLLRLHALLDAHELSTERAEQLLVKVADARVRQDVVSPPEPMALVEDEVAEPMPEAVIASMVPDLPTPVQVSAFEDDLSMRVYAHASIADHQEWEDQPLRDAVAVTDILLRTTPSGVPIIPLAMVVEPPALDASGPLVDDMLDTMDLSDVLPAPSLREAAAMDLLSVDAPDEPAPSPLAAALARSLTPLEPFDAIADTGIELEMLNTVPVTDALSGLSLDLADSAPASVRAGDTEFELDLAFDDPIISAAPPAPLQADNAPPVTPPSVAYPSPATNAGLLLDFAVEHGVVDAESEPVLMGPPISSPIPDALPEQPATPAAPVVQPGATQIVSAGSTAGIAPLSDIVATAPPTAAPTAPARVEAAEPTAAPGAGRPRTTESRTVRETPAPSGNGKLYMIIGGAVVAIGGAAAFFLLK